MLADLGGFVVDFRNLSVPTSPGDGEKTVPVRDEPENDHQVQEGKVIGQQDISVSEGRRTAKESTTHNVDFTSQSPAKQNPPPSRETNSPNDEVSKRIQQDDILTQPKNTETNDSESLRNSANMELDTSYPEDLTLTNFAHYLEKSFQFLGGFDWEPRAEHRQIVNSLAFEGHLGEWSSVKFEKWPGRPSTPCAETNGYSTQSKCGSRPRWA